MLVSFSWREVCWWHTVCPEFQVSFFPTLPSGRGAVVLSYAQTCSMCSHLLMLSPCSCLGLKGAWGRGSWGWAVVPRVALCCLLLGYPLGLIRELARHQLGLLFAWWQPADGHHLPWGSSLSPACCAQLGTGRFLLMRKGKGRGMGGYCSAHSWRVLEKAKTSPRLCELSWWCTSLP